jgi:hypothetical protein
MQGGSKTYYLSQRNLQADTNNGPCYSEEHDIREVKSFNNLESFLKKTERERKDNTI